MNEPQSTLYPEWLEAHKNDAPLLPERIRIMHNKYGDGPEGVTCQKCMHLYAHGQSRRYLKCDMNKFTRGPGTDWRARWPACGEYGEVE